MVGEARGLHLRVDPERLGHQIETQARIADAGGDDGAEPASKPGRRQVEADPAGGGPVGQASRYSTSRAGTRAKAMPTSW